MISKMARKRSNDPAQEALRQNKDAWNAEVSALISELISLKRGMNGKGDQDVGLPPSSIKYPLPPEIQQYLLGVSARSSKIFDFGRRIIDQQTEYASGRQKIASWAGSRLYSRFHLWRKAEKLERELRKELLKSSVKIVKKIKNLENVLLDYRNPLSIPLSFSLLSSTSLDLTLDFIPNFDLLMKILETLSSFDIKEKKQIENIDKKNTTEIKEKIDDSQKEIELIKKEQPYLSPIVVHLKSIISDKSELDKIDKTYNLFQKEFYFYIQLENKTKDEKQQIDEKKLIQLIIEHFNFIKNKIIEKMGPAASLEEYIKNISQETKKKAKEYDNHMQIEANFSIKKFINKNILSLSNKTVNKIRLEMVTILSEIRDHFDKMMDLLEKKESSLSSLKDEHYRIINKFYDILLQIEELGKLHNIEIRRDIRTKYQYQKDINAKDFSNLSRIKEKLTPYLFNL